MGHVHRECPFRAGLAHTGFHSRERDAGTLDFNFDRGPCNFDTFLRLKAHCWTRNFREITTHRLSEMIARILSNFLRLPASQNLLKGQPVPQVIHSYELGSLGAVGTD